MRCNLFLASLAASLAFAGVSHAAPFFAENFDVDPTASWTVNDNGNGTNAADFFFDYSSVGIPPAPIRLGARPWLEIEGDIRGTGPSERRASGHQRLADRSELLR